MPNPLSLTISLSSLSITVASILLTGVKEGDWGKTSRVWRPYLLLAAGGAVLGLLSGSFMYDGENGKLVSSFVAAYFLVQTLFIPSVRLHTEKGFSKKWVRLNLLSSCLPIFLLTYVLTNEKRGWQELALSYFISFHVFFNDFILYGILFF